MKKMILFLLCSFAIFEINSFSLASEIKPGWPVDISLGENVVIASSPVIADIDKNYSGLEVVVCGWYTLGREKAGRIFVYHQDGTIVNGWPKKVDNQIGSSPAVGDLDNDGELEIVVGSRGTDHAKLYAFRHDGTEISAITNYFDGGLNNWIVSSPSLVDIDADDDLEIIFADTYGGVYVIHHDDKNGDGKADNFSGWPVYITQIMPLGYSFKWLDSSPAVADIDRDGNPEIIIATWGVGVYAFHQDGSLLPGWPPQESLGKNFYSSPAIADIDKDYPGLEIIIGSKGYHDYSDDKNKSFVFAWHADGSTVASNWPFVLIEEGGAAIDFQSSPSIGDIDLDNKLEIIIGCQSNKVYAFHHDGVLVTGWPYQATQEVDSSAGIVDINNDYYPEAIIGDISTDPNPGGNGSLYILTKDAVLAEPFIDIEGGLYASPALADIDNDGKTDLVVAGQFGKVYAFSLFYSRGSEWPMFRHDLLHTGRYGLFHISAIGTYRPKSSTFFLKNSNSIDTIITFGRPGDIGIVGDWNGDGIKTIGIYRPSNKTFYLKNSNTPGSADMQFVYNVRTGTPVAGDWNGDGVDTIGIYNLQSSTFFLRNSNTSGPADMVATFGVNGDLPVIGDWDGNVTDTIGLYRPSKARFFLRNFNTTGPADITTGTYGTSAHLPVAGDWNGDGIDTIGLYGSGTFFLRDINTAGSPDIVVTFGVNGDKPLSGKWN